MINNITITEIQIIPIKPRNGLLAFCSFVLNNSFYVGDVALYSRLNSSGYRLVYPVKVLPNGVKINCFHPINHESSEAIEKQIIRYFIELLEKAKKKQGGGNDGQFRNSKEGFSSNRDIS